MVLVPKRSAKEDVLNVQEHCGLLGSVSSHSLVHKGTFARMWVFLHMVSLTIAAFLSNGDV